MLCHVHAAPARTSKNRRSLTAGERQKRGRATGPCRLVVDHGPILRSATRPEEVFDDPEIAAFLAALERTFGNDLKGAPDPEPAHPSVLALFEPEDEGDEAASADCHGN